MPVPEKKLREREEHRSQREQRDRHHDESAEFETFRIDVGHVHRVKPGNIVGAIANEAGLDGRDIGNIDIREDHSFVDLPKGMPKEIFNSLKRLRVIGRALNLTHVTSKPPKPLRHSPRERDNRKRAD